MTEPATLAQAIEALQEAEREFFRGLAEKFEKILSEAEIIKYAQDANEYHVVAGKPLDPEDNALCGADVLKMWLSPKLPELASVCAACEWRSLMRGYRIRG